MLEDFKEFYKHPKYSTNRMWHFFQHLHKQVGKASPPLFRISQPLLLIVFHYWFLCLFPTLGNCHFSFFGYSFLLLELSPCSCMPSSTFETLSLEDSFISCPHTTDHSVLGLDCISLCLYCLCWVLQSWKQMALINLPIRLVAGHPSVTMGSCLIIYLYWNSSNKISRIYLLVNSLDEKRKCHNPYFNIFYKT